MSDNSNSIHSSLKADLLAKQEAARRILEESAKELEIIKAYEDLMAKKMAVSEAVDAPIQVIGGFASLTKLEAATQVLRDLGQPSTVPAIFKAMKERGHPVKNTNALRALLMKSPQFQNNNGNWSLTAT